ncbi:MAG TPA: fumarylacetoacetate hydrolase family protein [Woeseiaceae bacterium]|nr:fumarylacetoacetate hydrolase family protein [Woeseiaceae bacterium]
MTRLSNQAMQNIATRFVEARKFGQSLVDYPGVIPADLESAYRIQDLAIDLWPESIAGWKVARISPALEDELGSDRLAGPVFNKGIAWAESGETPDMPIFVDGFAAVEAEFMAIIDSDAPADKLTWSQDEALAMIGDLRIGLEIAGGPLPTINQLGPAAVISFFGNNTGLVVGPAITDWRSRTLESLKNTTAVDGEEVGSGGAFNLSGGFVRSVQFLLELTAQRKRPLRAGDVIATGQTNGVHALTAGRISMTDFGDDGQVGVRPVAIS